MAGVTIAAAAVDNERSVSQSLPEILRYTTTTDSRLLLFRTRDDDGDVIRVVHTHSTLVNYRCA